MKLSSFILVWCAAWFIYNLYFIVDYWQHGKGFGVFAIGLIIQATCFVMTLRFRKKEKEMYYG